MDRVGEGHQLVRFALAACLLLLCSFGRPPDDDRGPTNAGDGTVACPSITVTPAGTANDYNVLGVTSLTIPAVTALSTDAIFVFVGINTPSGESVSPELTYNGAVFQPGGAGPPSFGDGSYSGELYILTDFTGTTADINIQLDIVDTPKAAAATAYVVSGLQDLFVNVVDPPMYSLAVGSSTTPSVTAGATAQACEFLPAMVVTKGPSSDAAGTWGNSFTGLQRVGTTAGALPSLNITVSDAYRAVTSVGTYTASKSAITSRPWLIFIDGFKQ